jgi:hypothetical protein
LVLNPTESGEWLANAVFMMLGDIRGHEEAGPEEGVYGGHTLAWSDIVRERRVKIEQDPYVLISMSWFVLAFLSVAKIFKSVLDKRASIWGRVSSK